MISVPNRQLRLSGNKYLLFALLVLFAFGCTGSKKAQDSTRRKVTKIRTNPTVKTEKKDTKTTEIKKDDKDWSDEVEKDVADEIDDTQTDQERMEDSYKKSVYNVSMFIPFNTSSSSSAISNVSEKFLNYYCGVRMALARLEEEGVSLNVRVFDSKKNFEGDLRDPFNKSADVIIGPYDTKLLKTLAVFGKENEIPVISPWKASKKIAEDNPYYVQLSPNPSDHFKKIVDHVNANFSPDQVFLLKRDINKDRNLAKYIQRYHASTNSGTAFNEYEIIEDSLQFGETAYDSLFLINRPTVFIIPNYSSKDESYIYNAVRRISTERGFNEVYVYGMPILLNSSKFTYDYYKNLNLRICSSKLVPYGSEITRSFDNEFYDRFGDLPKDDAYEGFDVMMFVGANLWNNGINFHKRILNEDQQLIQTIYNLSAVYKDSEDEGEIDKANYIQNMHLDIIQYYNDRFRRL